MPLLRMRQPRRGQTPLRSVFDCLAPMCRYVLVQHCRFSQQYWCSPVFGDHLIQLEPVASFGSWKGWQSFPLQTWHMSRKRQPKLPRSPEFLSLRSHLPLSWPRAIHVTSLTSVPSTAKSTHTGRRAEGTEHNPHGASLPPPGA